MLLHEFLVRLGILDTDTENLGIMHMVKALDSSRSEQTSAVQPPVKSFG